MDLLTGWIWQFLLLILIIIISLLWLYSREFRFRVKMAAYLVCVAVGGGLGGILSIPCGRTPKNHSRVFRTFQITTSWMGLKFELRHKENIVSEKPFVLIANHQTAIDVLGMTYAWPENCVVLLKSSLRFLPGFNLAAYLCNAIYINRFSKEKAHRSVDAVVDAITKNNRKVWIYPEGTRNANRPMLPFKKGAFLIAHRAKIPIVPVVFSSHKNFYDLSTFKFDLGGRCIIEALPPIDSTKFEDIESLEAECRQRMENAIDRLNEEVNGEKYSAKLANGFTGDINCNVQS